MAAQSITLRMHMHDDMAGLMLTWLLTHIHTYDTTQHYMCMAALYVFVCSNMC